VLNGTLALFDAEDVEALCSRALDDSLRSSSSFLRPHEREDALAFLVSEIWRLSLRFEPARGGSFERLAYRTARSRYVDWLRQRYGRTRWQFSDQVYERERAEPVELDLDGAGRDRLDDALGGWAGDNAADRAALVDGLLAGRDRQFARDADTLRAAARRLARS
jgi:hypothetical protein